MDNGPSGAKFNIQNAEIQTGALGLIRKPNETVAQKVVFPKPFEKIPTVFVSGYTSVLKNYGLTASNITKEGFTLYCYSETSDSMTVAWVAISK